MGRAAGRNAPNYDAVIIGWEVSQSYLYIDAFAPIPPREFLAMPKRLYDVGMHQYLSMGKYHFVVPSTREKSIEQLRGKRVLFVVPHKAPVSKQSIASSSAGTLCISRPTDQGQVNWL